MKPQDLQMPPSSGVGGSPAQSSPPSSPGLRLPFIDNLRWVMIVLVVSMHAAVTYSHLGSWYYMEPPQPGPLLTALFALYQMFLQAFFMGLLFLVAGYFIPAAFERKGFAKFIHDRAVRLGLPSLFFMLVIQPLTVFCLLPLGGGDRVPFFPAFRHYLTSGAFLSGSGPMWFTVALLFFTLVYGIIRVGGGKPQRDSAQRPLSLTTQTVALALVMGLCTFLVRVAQPIGTSVLNMQLCFFSQYILLFAAGIYAWRQNLLLRLPYGFGMRWLTLSSAIGTVVWLALVLAVLHAHAEPKLLGGFTWQSAVLSFWESFFCVGMCLGLIVLFREKCNHQGPVTDWLSRNCFSVYLFHTPILIAITLGLRSLAAPKPVKFLTATLLAVCASYLASSFVFRRVPLLRRIL